LTVDYIGKQPGAWMLYDRKKIGGRKLKDALAESFNSVPEGMNDGIQEMMYACRCLSKRVVFVSE
jgi:hypothetical protein